VQANSQTPYNEKENRLMATQLHTENKQSGTRWKSIIWSLGAGSAALGALAIVLVVGASLQGKQATASSTARSFQRIFADESAYLPSLAEYQAILSIETASKPPPAAARETGTIGETGALRCQIALSGLALCRPEVETAPGASSSLQTRGLQ
jgi:hypothetical protein